ncbi:hypothetical protein ACLK2H_09475 [Escherichia coli]
MACRWLRWKKAPTWMPALVDSELQPSRGQARKTIASNAVTINGEKPGRPRIISSTTATFCLVATRCYVVVKKNYCLICWK